MSTNDEAARVLRDAEPSDHFPSKQEVLPRQPHLHNVRGSMADLGRKHSCFKCQAKFYDLKKPKALCPKCGADQADAPPVSAAPPPPPPKRPRVVDPVKEEEELAVEEADGEEAADSDADLDLEGGEEAVVEEELDEPAGEDSYD